VVFNQDLKVTSKDLEQRSGSAEFHTKGTAADKAYVMQNRKQLLVLKRERQMITEFVWLIA